RLSIRWSTRSSPERREVARQEIPPELRRDVRLLGEVLGRVIADYGGPSLLRDVEKLRGLAIRARDDDRFERQAARLVGSWPLERAELVARAFTCYFHLANLAEEHHRARVIRERDRRPEPLPESIASAVNELRPKLGRKRFDALIANLEIHPVFTAHPTEARRRAIVTAIRRVGEQLERLDDPLIGERENDEVLRRLAEEMEGLWRTAQVRSAHVTPLDEVRTFMNIFDESLFRMAPEVLRSMDTAMGTPAPAFLRFGSWIGGDRDGNPSVTADVTAETMAIQSEHVLLGLEAVATRIGRALTLDAVTTPASRSVLRRIGASAREPHREFLLEVARRIRATRLGETGAYEVVDDLLDDLRTLQRSLAIAGAKRLASGELQHLIWQAETFGFHLADLEIRQHSKVHAQALAEIRSGGEMSEVTRSALDTLAAVRSVQERVGIAACRRYIVSFTRSAADVAAVYELADSLGARKPLIEVIPLFETLEDLACATRVLDEMLELPPVQQRIKSSGRRLEVMLGYSDSAKEAGPLSATLALHDAQAALTAWAKKNKLRLTLFHGRGGALGRGGGPANRAVRAQAPGSVAGHFKVTEQGEVIFARYGNRAIARRHVEQVTSAVLEASVPKSASSDPARGFRELAAMIDHPSRDAYRRLVEAPGFETWFLQVSPIEELGRLRIASRPARRAAGQRLQDLRAIPWVFAWSQMRLNLAGWYGMGSGLAAAPLSELRRAYAEWPLFNVMLDNAEMSLAKTDRRIAERYLALGDRTDLAEIVLAEYELTKDRVLAVTGHRRLLEDRRVLSWAIELRNPYVDALSHLQLRALRAMRDRKTSRADRIRAERVFQLTVNGVAAGLQNTG
ncbi:MAG TPA: phosphoenolpyruvate carboxylase, partial [Stellaceae bacterium]|nr:phosphoenolpyruvate carboxylase [Stellaceae bacterium]